MKRCNTLRLMAMIALGVVLVSTGAFAQALPGGTLDPLTVPKYVTPLVIPPVMNTKADPVNGLPVPDNYDISVRQFQQQILPGGIWNVVNGRADAFPATTIWSYGPSADPAPDASALGIPAGIAPAPNSQFNYPSYTLETTSNVPVNVRWTNDLVATDPATGFPYPVGSPNRTYLPHILAVDQTLHWANPSMDCIDGVRRTDCMGWKWWEYQGPVPIVTHVHGAHVAPHSDGYPEAWWLPAASNIPAGWATEGTLFDDALGQAPGLNTGYVDFSYAQTQPATTLWYHDHALGMTRNNVYAGPAGFWLIRGGMYDGAVDGVGGGAAVLPGPAPVAGEQVLDLNIPGNAVRSKIREIPVVVQDRSFNIDGSLFYPNHRSFFEGLTPRQLRIFFIPFFRSDIHRIWNPEAFFNTMVVNGVSWPTMEVAQDRYRLRMLNGCNSRFLNLAMFVVNPDGTLGAEIPFYQIGAEQGFLPQVVKISTGFATPLPGDGTVPADLPQVDPQSALLMGLAERADTIVDFSGLPNGTVVRMINTAPDAPFGGFPDIPADPGTTGQVMQFVVTDSLNGAPGSTDGTTTPPENLQLNIEPPLGPATVIREVSLNEEESASVCVRVRPNGTIRQLFFVRPGPNFLANCARRGGVPFAPKAALLGTVDQTNPAIPLGIPLKWTDTTGVSTPVPVTLQNGAVLNINVTENPTVGAIEEWDIYNFTVDSHPIHLHLVRFEVVNRVPIPGMPPVAPGVQPWEMGYKDTVIAYPGEITTVRAKFDLAGLYVWHCHIVEHEDNEMMRPYVVSP